jgi:hypothetical protein
MDIDPAVLKRMHERINSLEVQAQAQKASLDAMGVALGGVINMVKDITPTKPLQDSIDELNRILQEQVVPALWARR